MKNLFKIAAVVTVGALLVTGAFAQAKKPAMKAKPAAHAKMAAAVKCPVCKMPLSAKMTKADPVAVNVKGKTMYCCAGCKMPKSMLAKMPAKKMMAKSHPKKMTSKKK